MVVLTTTIIFFFVHCLDTLLPSQSLLMPPCSCIRTTPLLGHSSLFSLFLSPTPPQPQPCIVTTRTGPITTWASCSHNKCIIPHSLCLKLKQRGTLLHQEHKITARLLQKCIPSLVSLLHLGEPYSDPERYKRLVRKLIYHTITRSNISLSIGNS